MTLIITLANREQAILVSDRRLTVNGALKEDDSNKAAMILLRDSRLAVAFTGLATAGNFRTDHWLAISLAKLAAPEYSLEPLLRRFAQQAGEDFRRLELSREAKRLTVVFVGYSYNFEPPRAGVFWVSNFEGQAADPVNELASDKFEVYSWLATHPPPDSVCILGKFGAAVDEDLIQMGSLHELLHAKRPASALVGKAIEGLHRASEASSTIGKRATSIVVPSDPTLMAAVEYHTDRATHRSGGIIHIEARGGKRGTWMLDLKSHETYDAAGAPQVSVVPKVGKNQPCPCGSGKKYKRCHGETGDDWRVIVGGEPSDN